VGNKFLSPRFFLRLIYLSFTFSSASHEIDEHSQSFQASFYLILEMFVVIICFHSGFENIVAICKYQAPNVTLSK